MQIKRILAAVLAALCLSSTALAEGIGPRVEDFIAEHGLNESNFSLCYYNTVTGEEYCYR